jgi:hypothetical protein
LAKVIFQELLLFSVNSFSAKTFGVILSQWYIYTFEIGVKLGIFVNTHIPSYLEKKWFELYKVLFPLFWPQKLISA